jgi:hypothetical protein
MQDLEFRTAIAAIQMSRGATGTISMGGNGQFTRLSALDSIAGPTGSPWRGSLLEDFELGVHLLTAGYPVPVELRREHVMLHYGTMASRHHPTAVFEGRILYLRAEHSLADRGWHELATDGVEVVSISGRHRDMERQPGLGDAGAALATALDRLSDRG